MKSIRSTTKTLIQKSLTKFSFSKNTRPKESNLKGYIINFRKHAHKYANLDPLDIIKVPKSESLSPEFWELSQIEKIEDFPIDESSAFNNNLVENNITVEELDQYLTKTYLNGVRCLINNRLVSSLNIYLVMRKRNGYMITLKPR
jgi:2-oxoglutarate dehydrogenase complex dehydrogenase (E1) component-like enzyme